MGEYIFRGDHNYFWGLVLMELDKKMFKFLCKTPITPNMVTLFNLFVNTVVCCLSACKKNYVITAVFIQIYMLLDCVDGDLARNKRMTTELGKKLDEFADFVFFTVFYLVLGWNMDISFWWAVALVVVQHIYGFTATYYIVPRIRKYGENFKRTRIKKFFYDRGILFGMDVTLQCLVTTLMLITPYREYLFLVNTVLWVVDLIYRLYEVQMQK